MTTHWSTARQNKAEFEEKKAEYLEICRQLNMDSDTEKAAWQSFVEVSQNNTLQGDANHWLCCAVYTACRDSFIPTVGNTNAVVAGNCVSLTKLLRSCNISINEFCNKIKVWANLKNISKGLRLQIERLEQSVQVSLCVYQKYEEIFPKLFMISSIERKKKKAKPGRCSASKLYDFCWCLFIAAQGEEPNRKTDLVQSLHLLLCCIDLIFVNAVIDDRRDIIRSDFSGLPSNWASDTFDATSLKDFCVIRELCELISGDYLQVVNVKRSSWKNIMTKFIKHKTLLCNSPVDIISNIYFEPNLKSLNNTYEQYILSVGEFDERIFLNSEKEKPVLQSNSILRSGMPGTPASSAATIANLESMATKDVSKEFMQIIGDAEFKLLEERLDRLKKLLVDNPANIENFPMENIFAHSRVLYYALLLKIIPSERKIKPQLNYKTLLQNNILQITLFSCCVEILLFLRNVKENNAKLVFPWILECFEQTSYHFYRIIEIVVQNHGHCLNRDTIAHLNTIECMCLEDLCWRAGSSLWDAIKAYGSPLPKYEKVHYRNINTNGSSCKKAESNLHGNFLQSPSTSMGVMQTTSTTETARRTLFSTEPGVKTTTEAEEKKIEANPQKPRAGSLTLFLRKFYELSYDRISKLCEVLKMKENVHLDIIWTIFEYCITNQTSIMRNRHLNQIIMCSIYVLIKVKDIPGKSFTDIMSYARQVLKTPSSIYRQVLLNVDDVKPINGDIIQFYNSIYVTNVSQFALTFADKNKETSQLLSPHPPDRVSSPVQVSNYHVYVQALSPNEGIQPSGNVLCYNFEESPSRLPSSILNAVNSQNELTSDEIRKRKHKLTFDENEMHMKAVGGVENKIRKIVIDRRAEGNQKQKTDQK